MNLLLPGIFDLSETQAESAVEPDGMTYRRARKSVVRIGIFSLVQGPILYETAEIDRVMCEIGQA